MMHPAPDRPTEYNYRTFHPEAVRDNGFDSCVLVRIVPTDQLDSGALVAEPCFILGAEKLNAPSKTIVKWKKGRLESELEAEPENEYSSKLIGSMMKARKQSSSNSSDSGTNKATNSTPPLFGFANDGEYEEEEDEDWMKEEREYEEEEEREREHDRMSREKLGGYPCWVQSAYSPKCTRVGCCRVMRQVFQLKSHEFFGHTDGIGHVMQCPVHKEVVDFGWSK